MWSILLTGAVAFAPPLVAVRPTHPFVPRVPRAYPYVEYSGNSGNFDVRNVYTADSTSYVSQSQDSSWFVAALALTVGFGVGALAMGGREAQYAAELADELGATELEAAEKTEDMKIRQAKVAAKDSADKREMRREISKIPAIVDPEGVELKQKHAAQEKWDAKKAKWERKEKAAAEATEMEDEDDVGA